MKFSAAFLRINLLHVNIMHLYSQTVLVSLLTRKMSRLPSTNLSLSPGLPVDQLETLFPLGHLSEHLSELGRGLAMGQVNYLGCLL